MFLASSELFFAWRRLSARVCRVGIGRRDWALMGIGRKLMLEGRCQGGVLKWNWAARLSLVFLLSWSGERRKQVIPRFKL